jgi:hypothetical protein
MDSQDYILEIIDELSLVFWLSIYLVSPVFSILEVVVQEAINKMIYFLANKVQLVREKIQKIGFNSNEKLQNVQNLHSEYEKKKSLSEKLKISEDFLDETRGGMFLLNEMSENVMGKIRTLTTDDNLTEDNCFFDRDIISKQDFSIKELEVIQKNIKVEKLNGKTFYTNSSIRKNVTRERIQFKDDKFKKEFISMFQQVESDFLENIEMYLFQKKVYRKWKIFKVIAFIPFMLFLSELVEIIFGIFFENFISN